MARRWFTRKKQAKGLNIFFQASYNMVLIPSTEESFVACFKMQILGPVLGTSICLSDTGSLGDPVNPPLQIMESV